MKNKLLLENINKVKTNTLISLTKKSMTKAEDLNSNNYYIFCNKCNNLLGFEIKNTINEKDENNNEDYHCYLLKKNIKERNNKNININLISFKANLLKSIKEELNKIFN